MTPQQASGPRSTNACERCRRRKVKCSGERPCTGCRRHRVNCVFATHGRSRLSEEQVQALLDKIDTYEERLKKLEPSTSENSNAQLDAGAPAPEAGTAPGRPPPPARPMTATGLPVTSSPTAQDTSPAGSDRTERPTGPAYESRVRYLLRHSQKRPEGSPSRMLDIGGHTDPMTYAPARPSLELSLGDWLKGAPPCSIPSEAESRRLMELFLTYLGVNQHFFDPRDFIDTMSTLYQGETARQKLVRTSWYVEYLLIMAMANLMDFNTPSSDIHHGFDFFGEAMNRLPPMHQFTGSGVLVIEILMLIALYLQWRSRKHDAYLYIGFAVRHAIAMGCAISEHTHDCRPSERAHRVRVWWTAFMLDRRLSADLGLPSASDDRQIAVQLPTKMPGFPSPEALIINIKIARTTSNIMTSLYGNAVIVQQQLVQDIQDTLQSLYEIGHSIPPEYVIDLSKPSPAVTRTGSSLYLMLFQAIILCARPMLLQRVKDKVSAPLNGGVPQPTTEMMARLSTTCKQSAINSIRILYSLRMKQQIARFGFFDLDATFSAALTLIMVGFAENTDLHNMMPELHQAVDILQYLSRAGNKAAEQRLADVDQFSVHVWGSSPRPSGCVDTEVATTASHGIAQSALDLVPREDQPPGPLHAQSNQAAADYSMDQHEQSVFGYAVDFQNGFNFDMDLHTDADGIFSSFNDPNLPLTGVDELDWAEIGRIFTGLET